MPTNWIVMAIVALTPVVLMVIDWAFGKFGTIIPSWVKPILVTGLGAVVTLLSGIVTADPLKVALIALACAGIRQIVVWLGRAANLKFFA